MTSTLRTFQALLRHRAQLVGVLGLAPEAAKDVSGYRDLTQAARDAGIPAHSFQNINAPMTVEKARQWSPDLLFVVGLSQLVKDEMMHVPTVAGVGFHPTRLPRGRGRAPVAWLILNREDGAATFFVLEKEADAGGILAQEPFMVAPTDYASDVVVKIEDAIDVALDRWLPQLIEGQWDPQVQDESQATWTEKRTPADGLIDWSRPAQEIHRLIRATSRPHPGAFSYRQGKRVLIWRAQIDDGVAAQGLPGSVLLIEEGQGALVQCGDGALWLTEVEASDINSSSEFQAGERLGVSP